MGARAPVRTCSPLFYIHCELAAGARAELPVEYPERAAYVAAGAIEVDGEQFTEGRMLVFEPGAVVEFTAAGPAVVMLLGGEPLGERYVDWNFVSSSKERIAQAKADWRAGRMKLPDLDDGEFIPLPPDSRPAPNPMS
jgi:redox-sensitive bicupin YhaK (pirin superfamily)